MRLQHRVPDNYERYLMDLLQFQSLPDLESFLNGPSHPAFLQQSQVPNDLYEQAEKEADDELHRGSLEENLESLSRLLYQ